MNRWLIEWTGRRHSDRPKDALEMSWAGLKQRVSFLPMRDASKREVGDMIVIQDTTVQSAAIRSFIGVVAAVCGVAASGLLVLFFVILGATEKSLDVARQKASGESRAREGEQRRHIKASEVD